jgi:spore germination protein GerM
MQLQTYISDLLYRYDCVIVPEFGAFITQRVSAEVNTTNNTFFAPKKALLFNEQISNNDGLLTRYIADVEQIPFEAANQKISKQVQRFKSTLIEGETLYFEGIGELTFNALSKIDFTPTYSVNYLTDAFGLSQFNSGTVSRGLITPTEDVEIANENPVIPLVKQSKNYKTYLKYAAVGLIALTLSGFAFSKYQLDQINKGNQLAIEEAQLEIESKIQEATFVISNPLPTVKVTLDKEAIGSYHIIAGAFRVEKNCDKKIEQLKANGFKARKIGVNKYGLHQVAYQSYTDRLEALSALRTIKREQNSQAWLLVKALD